MKMSSMGNLRKMFGMPYQCQQFLVTDRDYFKQHIRGNSICEEINLWSSLRMSEGKCSEAISNRNDIHDGNPLPPNRKTSNPAGLKTQIGPLLFFSPSLCCTTLNLLSTTGPMITPEQKRNCYEEQFALYIPFTQNKRSDLI